MDLNKIKGKIKKHFKEVIKIKKSPHSVALGFAIGTFIAILPTFGFGILIGTFILLFFKKVSKLSMIAAFILWNPFFLMPFYVLSFKIGDFILNKIPVIRFKITLLNQIYHLSIRFLLGNFIIALFLSLFCYLCIKHFMIKYKNKKAHE